MQNNTKKAEVPCPMCSHKFIPEAFHIEKIIMDTRVDGKGTHIIGDRTVMNEIAVKPSNHIRKVWITNCPQCNYVLRFTAEVAKKELNELEGKKVSSFDEFGIKYFYNLYSYPKPFMDYTDYYIEAITKIKAEIAKSLESLNIDEWGLLCRGFLTEKNIDPFKFLIRFYANLENYCNSTIDNSKEKDMYQKIKQSDFPQQLEFLLDETRKLRNEVVHESYDLNEDDVALIKDTFLNFLSYLISTELAKLRLKSQVENIEYKFINKKGLFWEIKRFLHVDLGEKLKFQGYYNDFLMPLLDELGIPK